MIGPQAARPLRVTRRHSIRRRNPRERQRRADEVPGRPPHSVAAAKTRPPRFVAPCFAPFRVASPLYRQRPHYPASVALSAGLKHPSASNATTVHVAPGWAGRVRQPYRPGGRVWPENGCGTALSRNGNGRFRLFCFDGDSRSSD